MLSLAIKSDQKAVKSPASPTKAAASRPHDTSNDIASGQAPTADIRADTTAAGAMVSVLSCGIATAPGLAPGHPPACLLLLPQLRWISGLFC